MIGHWRFYSRLLLLALVSQTSSLGCRAAGRHRTVSRLQPVPPVVDGLELQYLSAGHGPAIVLLHGYAETSRDVAAIDSAVGGDASP